MDVEKRTPEETSFGRDGWIVFRSARYLNGRGVLVGRLVTDYPPPPIYGVEGTDTYPIDTPCTRCY